MTHGAYEARLAHMASHADPRSLEHRIACVREWRARHELGLHLGISVPQITRGVRSEYPGDAP